VSGLVHGGLRVIFLPPIEQALRGQHFCYRLPSTLLTKPVVSMGLVSVPKSARHQRPGTFSARGCKDNGSVDLRYGEPFAVRAGREIIAAWSTPLPAACIQALGAPGASSGFHDGRCGGEPLYGREHELQFRSWPTSSAGLPRGRRRTGCLRPGRDRRNGPAVPTPLTRSAIYQTASVSQRRAAHAALAGLLYRHPDRRAWHRAAAVLGPDEQVAADLEAAAVRAERRGAVVMAVDAFRRAAQLSEDAPRRGRRLQRATLSARRRAR
jgi:hypothetical protein